jgi:predicted transposase/invertase (TIGR01784 family)
MSKQLASIHDAFFKQVLSDPMLASTFLREHLPPEVASLLGSELPELIPGSFVDEELRQHHSDLLFRVQLKGGCSAFAYVLMEHKSSPDPAARLQLLRYMVRLLTHWHDQNGQQLPLPPVLPLLAHQGPEGWKVSCEFTDLFGTVPDALRPYLPSFRHALVDLAPMEDRELSAEVRLRAFLKALKYRRRSDLPECIDIVLAEAPALEEEDLFVILTYLDKGPTAVNNKVVYETLERLVPERKERIVGWLTQPYYDKGKAEGFAEGTAVGEATILTRLLEKRFGAIPVSVRQRIFSADVGCIEAWVERLLDAPNLQSVFD